MESLLAVYMGTTPAKAPETRWVSCVVIQLVVLQEGGFKEPLVRDTAGESFAKGLMQKYSRSTGHPRALKELHLAFKYTRYWSGTRSGTLMAAPK